MDFSVNAGMSILVTHLGAFDSSQDGFSSPVQIGIFDRNTSLLVVVSATLNGTAQPLVGNSRFFDIADFTLGAGDYSIVAVGFNAFDLNANIDFGGVGANHERRRCSYLHGIGTLRLLANPSIAKQCPVLKLSVKCSMLEVGPAAGAGTRLQH